MTERTTLRMGVLCGERAIQHWQAESVRQLLSVPGVQLVVWIAVQQDEVAPAPARRTAEKTKHDGTGILARIAQWLPRPAQYHAFTVEDPERSLSAVRKLSAGRADATLEIGAKERDELRSLQLDVVVALSDPHTAATSLGSPSLGIWSFHPALSPDGIDEGLFGDPASAAFQLIRQDASGGKHVLREARFASQAMDAPVDAALTSCACWPAQVAREILVSGTTAASGMTDARTAKEIPPRTSFGKAGAFWRAIQKKLFKPEQVSFQEWNIGILHQPITALLEENASMNVRWLPPPSSGRSRSEAFGYDTVDGQLNVLYRKHGGSSGQSSIARLRPKSDNVLKRSRPMLEGAGITGYPYVVQHDGTVYVVVTHLTGTDLYRINGTNDGLEHITVLVNRPLHAPTLFHAHGRWWLFTADPALPDTALLAFHSSELRGPYTPHVMNPLKLDARSARPAGTPFESGGNLWRPALDTTNKDLYTVVLNRIDTLTPELFAETTVKRLEPFRGTTYGHGVRTLCAMGPITLVDGLRSPLVPGSKANTSRGKLRSSSSKRK